MNYKINAIYKTIQGEGCLTGTPMLLVRFQGCSVNCPWCDTPEAKNPNAGASMSLDEICDRIEQYSGDWILLTGGEPAEQPINKIITRCNKMFAVETSGTVNIDVLCDWLCVSPKRHCPPIRKLLARADEIKMVVEDESDIVFLEKSLMPGVTGQVCVQPMSLNDQATKLCIKTVMERQWRLSVQTHKLIGIS